MTVRTAHGTLAAGVVTTVELDRNWTTVEVLNADGAAEIWVTIDGAAPVAGANGTYRLPAVIAAAEWPAPARTLTVVKLLSAGTPTYSVQGAS